MQKYKSLVLPVALIAGYLLREICSVLSMFVPPVIFLILVLTFSGVRLSALRPDKLDLVIASFQTIFSILLYYLLLVTTSSQAIAQGAMMCVLCPVASSVTVVATMLGANPVRTTTYTIVGNLLIVIIAPVYFSIISPTTNISFGQSLLLILTKIAGIIALPYIIILVVQRFIPKLNASISRFKNLSFYLWAFALFVTIGHTADYVVLGWHGEVGTITWLGIVSLIICIAQFVIGKRIGKRYGDRIAGGQILAQKNSAMGIWMLNTFLNPLASVALAFYSIWQNIFNSYQIYNKSSE